MKNVAECFNSLASSLGDFFQRGKDANVLHLASDHEDVVAFFELPTDVRPAGAERGAGTKIGSCT